MVKIGRCVLTNYNIHHMSDDDTHLGHSVTSNEPKMGKLNLISDYAENIILYN